MEESQERFLAELARLNVNLEKLDRRTERLERVGVALAKRAEACAKVGAAFVDVMLQVRKSEGNAAMLKTLLGGFARQVFRP